MELWVVRVWWERESEDCRHFLAIFLVILLGDRTFEFENCQNLHVRVEFLHGNFINKGS